MKKIAIVLLLAFTAVSCNTDKDDNPSQTSAPLTLVFNNQVNGEELVLGNAYENNSQETYKINELKYIVSNITLTKEDGTQYIHPVEESYFLINEENQNTLAVNLPSIDVANYTKLTFGFGVDPTKYPIESGSMNFIPTAEEAGMLWNWAAGYKFIKLEGDYSIAASTEENPFIIHVGSHGANLDNYKEIEIDLSSTRTESADRTSPIAYNFQINFDIATIFDGPNTIKIQDKAEIQVDPINAPKIADNIKTAFSLTRN